MSKRILIFCFTLIAVQVVCSQPRGKPYKYTEFLKPIEFKPNSVEINQKSKDQLDSLLHFLFLSRVLDTLNVDVAIRPVFCEKEHNVDPFLGIKRAKVVHTIVSEKLEIDLRRIRILDLGLYERGTDCMIRQVEIMLLSLSP